MFDVSIKNARLLDTETGRESRGTVLVNRDKIVEVLPEEAAVPAARKVLDAQGNYVFPGFVDYHVHLFRHGSGFGLDANRLAEAGVTTACDMGTAGYANYAALHACDLVGKKLRLHSYLNISPVGQPGRGINEPLDDKVLDLGKMEALLDAYPGEIRGLKVRISQNIVGDLRLRPLQKAVEMGEALGLPVCVHTTNPPESMGKVASLLRPGDIFSHVYHGSGRTLLGENGHVEPEILEARQRGVLFDVGNGRVNFNFPAAEGAFKDGFYPDIISSDSTITTFHKEPAMWDLPRCMSKLLNMGMSLSQVLTSVTTTPAKVLGLEDTIGKVAPGYCADLVLCKLQEGPVTFVDSAGNERTGTQQLLPYTTLRAGRVIWQQEQ